MSGQEKSYADLGWYRRLVEKINYLTVTHPDILVIVSVVSPFLSSSSEEY